jgi:hypothetical protein
MTEPEISRRCRFCGASIRVRGFFCPQCGRPTSEQEADSASEELSMETEEVAPPPDTVSVDLERLPTVDISINRTASANAETVPLYPLPGMPEASTSEPDHIEANAPTSPAPFQSSEASLPVGGSRTRAMTQVPAEVKRGLGKVREISTVMLDEAAYDPSARFVLVAGVLFVLFLIILILSEMMR